MREDEFRTLFENHYSAVLGYALRRTDPDSAGDVVAETFLVAWRRLKAPPETPLPWLLAVARRVLANELRRQGRATRLAERAGREASAGDRDVTTDPGDDRVEAVRQALAGLPERDRELLTLIGWDQLDQTSAAQVIGCSVGTLKVRLHRARKRLRAALDQQATAVDPTPARTPPSAVRSPPSQRKELRS